MDAIKLLKQQHREVQSLFKQFDSAGDGAGEVRLGLFIRIADTLAAHTAVEERIFYPSVFVGPSEHMLRLAVEEHLAVKRVLADLLDMEPGDEQFEAKMQVLRELFTRHVQEEERDLLPGVQGMLTRKELQEMGEQMESLFSELIQSEPRREIPDQTESAPPLA
jgi:hypothetical protein